MPIIEFAVISLKSQTSPTDSNFINVLRDCLVTLSRAAGASGFRFLNSTFDSSPASAYGEGQLLALIGLWHTVEEHLEFLHSGAAAGLLARLEPYIEVREVIHVIPELGLSADLDGVMNATTFTSFVIDTGSLENNSWFNFIKDYSNGIGKGSVIGQKAKKSKGAQEAQVLVRKSLGQDVSDYLKTSQDDYIWVFFEISNAQGGIPSRLNVIKEIGLTGRVESREWTTLVEL
ncbi:hypothetical protein OIDMADRAFT_61776 [Oidiodendron maius Zn]|uniref:Uncharacterized protein n=1 Tax=Oidiodendron maius (strain Zn) TaxID=913774 RepID=A0A0C3GPE5_OIDMZ|nr:hypothetical protein OIDMADRAFT_61776 [Oidiodendron maius Zn]